VIAQEHAFALLGLEQRELPLRQSKRERYPGRAAAGTDVDDEPGFALYEFEPAQRIVQEPAPRVAEVADRCQPGRRDDGPEPALRRG